MTNMAYSTVSCLECEERFAFPNETLLYLPPGKAAADANVYGEYGRMLTDRVWCFRCERPAWIERIPNVREFEVAARLRAMPDRPALPNVEDELLDIPDAEFDFLRRHLTRRTATGQCLTCGSPSVRRLDVAINQVVNLRHPLCGGALQVESWFVMGAYPTMARWFTVDGVAMETVGMNVDFGGTGPGARTRDGCSVELYRRARYAGEIEHLRPLLPPGTTVLELGCGTGLLTHRLLEFGCKVTGVDNSEEMLAHVSGQVRKVHADIVALALPERFDVVLIPSGLINHADAAVRRGFVAAAARHVAPGGAVILKCQSAHWLRTVMLGRVAGDDDEAIDVIHVDRTPDEQGLKVNMTLKYTMGDDEWTHSFAVVPMDEAAITQLLGDEGFQPPEALDAKREWFAARRGSD